MLAEPFIDQVRVDVGSRTVLVAHLESYPEEVLLRIRVNEHTVVLQRLSGDDLSFARSSPDNLAAVATAKLSAVGIANTMQSNCNR
jgi:hypothetical protein